MRVERDSTAAALLSLSPSISRECPAGHKCYAAHFKLPLDSGDWLVLSEDDFRIPGAARADRAAPSGGAARSLYPGVASRLL